LSGGRVSSILKRVYVGLILLFLYAPIIVLIVFSFNASRSRGRWGGFTLSWYAEMFRDRQIMGALWNTVAIAVLSAALAGILGTASAIGINAMKKIPRKIMLTANNLPVLNPDIVTGVSLMILFIFVFNTLRAGSLGFLTMLLAHVAFNAPYVILSVLPKLSGLDPNMYEAALDLGCRPAPAFFKVILPEISQGIISGVVLAFTLSIDDFVISFFTKGPGFSNLSIIVYSMARRGVNPKINAVSTLIFVTVMLLLALVNKLNGEKLKS
jgi:spermidine/putrescine transport system permease protein